MGSQQGLAVGQGVALFVRAFGLCLAHFAHYTAPGYIDRLDHTVLAFAYPPWHHLGQVLSPMSAREMDWVRVALLACGCAIALGVAPRLCLGAASGCVTYFLSLDRTVYNNHYVLLIILCLALLGVDQSCLCWRPWESWLRASPTTSTSPASSPAPPLLPHWQLVTVKAIVLTPYFYGGLAKLQPSWLLEAQPVLSWADGLLGDLDAFSAGHLGDVIDALCPPGVDPLRAFALVVSWAGMLLDLIAPLCLFFAHHRPGVRLAVAAICVLFHLINRLWFGLGCFPFLNIAALALFVVPFRASSCEEPSCGARRAPPVAAGASFPRPRRRWPKQLVQVLAIPYALLPLRYFAWHTGTHSALWTDEGQLYAWRMKSVERTGWVRLELRGRRRLPSPGGASCATASTPRLQSGKQEQTRPSATDEVALSCTPASAAPAPGSEAAPDGAAEVVYRLNPETDTALHPDQAGELAHNPLMLLRYAAHLARLARLHEIDANVSVSVVGSCVSTNGRPAQPLFKRGVNLLGHVDWYTSLQAELTAQSGVGRFLHPWQLQGHAMASNRRQRATQPRQAAMLCDPHAVPPEQNESDASYRALYRPLFTRQRLADWPWDARTNSRLPAPLAAAARSPPASCAAESTGVGGSPTCASDVALAEGAAPPAWATACSFLHAAGSKQGAVWCPQF